MTSLFDKARRSTVCVLPAQLLTKAMGLAYLLILTRGLSIPDYGAYNFLIGLLIVFGYLCNFGLAASLQRFLPEYSKLGRYRQVIRAILYAHSFRAVLSVIFLTGAVLWFSGWAPRFGMQDRRQEFVIFAVGAFLLYQIEYFQTELNALFMHVPASLAQIFYTLAKFPAVLGLLMLGFGLAGVLAAEALAYLFGLTLLIYVFVWRLYRRYSTQPRSTGHTEDVRRIVRYTAFNAMVGPGAILYSNAMDYFIVAAMANSYELGLYALAARTSMILRSLMPQNVLQSVIRPAFYQRYYSVSDRNAELNRMFRMLVELIAAFLFPLVAIVGVAAEPLFPMVFGQKYSAAVPVFLIFLLFMVFTILDFSSDMVLQAIEKVEAHLYAQLFALYNVAAAILLMPYFGILGVAFATGSALMCKYLYFYYMANRYTGVTIRWVPVFRIAFNASLAGAAAFYINSFGSRPIYAWGSVAVGFVVYGIGSVLNNFMDVQEKSLVNRLLKRRIFDV